MVRYGVDFPRQYRRIASRPECYHLRSFLMQGGHKIGHSFSGIEFFWNVEVVWITLRLGSSTHMIA
jgi:hypothetical protein